MISMDVLTTKSIAGVLAASGCLAWLLYSRRKTRIVLPGERDPANFGAFLKKAPPAQSTSQEPLPKHLRNPADFGAFLKSTSQPTAPIADTQVGQGAPAAVPAGPLPHQVVVTVLYGTEYGFSKEVAEKLCNRLEEHEQPAIWPRLVDMADHPALPALPQEQLLLVVCSTQGDGVPPSEARPFCDWLHSSAAPTLQGVKYAVCALGDRSYTHFCRCGKQLDARFAELGADRLASRVDVDKEDWKAIESWLSAVLQALPTAGLKVAQDTDMAVPATVASVPKGWSKSRPYWATVVAVEGLCNISSEDDKNTFRVEFDLGESGLKYVPGDALGIYPRNCPEAVDELLDVLGLPGSTLVPCPGWQYANAEGLQVDSMALRDALLHFYDIRSPKPDIITSLAKQLPGAKLSEQLLEICEACDSTAIQSYLEPRHVVDVMEELLGLHAPHNGHMPEHANRHANGYANSIGHSDGYANGQGNGAATAAPASITNGSATAAKQHDPAAVPNGACSTAQHLPKQLLPQFLKCLRPLVARLYSISSSQRENQRTVQATIALVRYQLRGRSRIGVASTFCGERIEVGSRVPVYISTNPDFRLPASPSTPLIMVGPGTGLAPFRAFVQERLLTAQDSTAALGPALLFFGCRRRDQDYLYGSLLEEWHKQGHIQLFTAFSREQGHKVYVQQRLREQGELVWRLLQQGGHFYVCGDAGSMAAAVEAALLDIIAQHMPCTAEGAQAFLETLQNEHRYERDVW